MIKSHGGIDMGPIPEGWDQVKNGNLQDGDMCWDIELKRFMAVKNTTPYHGGNYGIVSDYHLLIRKLKEGHEPIDADG